MDEHRTPDTGKRQDFRKVQKANGGMLFRVFGICVVLYWMLELVVAYCKGGPDAPSLTILLVGIVVLGGGAVLVGILTWKAWKAEKALAELTAEEAAELDALRAGEEE